TDSTRPLIGGDGIGGSLVYEAAASAPESTFRGALSVSFSQRFASPKPFCEVTHPKTAFDAAHGTARLVPVPSMKTPWAVVQGASDPYLPPDDVSAFQATLIDAKLHTVAG